MYIEMYLQYLDDLKEKRARIIIADTNDKVARQVMCEAYLLEMTAVQVTYIIFHRLSRSHKPVCKSISFEKISTCLSQIGLDDRILV